MPERLTIEYVKGFVRDKSKGECEVLSNEYINSVTPLLVRCKCGEEFCRTFNKLKQNTVYCKKCSVEYKAEQFRLNLDDVIENISQKGCEYISGEYENNRSLLKIRCRCGNVFEKSYAKFMHGQDRCPECGRKSLAESKTKYSVDDVQREISKDGYCILDKSKYIDAATPIECVCKRGHVFNLIFSEYLGGHSGCKKCSAIRNAYKRHWNYKNGDSLVEEALRAAVNSWKKDIKKSYGMKCCITGMKSNIVVHHLTDYKTIVEEVSRELNIPILERIRDYDDYEDFILFKERFVEKHTEKTGIPITKKVHSQFHQKYVQRATAENFDKFLKETYNTCLDDVFEKQNKK